MKESVEANKDWNTPAEKKHVLDLLSRARGIYARMER